MRHDRLYGLEPPYPEPNSHYTYKRCQVLLCMYLLFTTSRQGLGHRGLRVGKRPGCRMLPRSLPITCKVHLRIRMLPAQWELLGQLEQPSSMPRQPHCGYAEQQRNCPLCKPAKCCFQVGLNTEAQTASVPLMPSAGQPCSINNCTASEMPCPGVVTRQVASTCPCDLMDSLVRS